MTRERVQLLERVQFVKQALTGAHHPGTTQCWTAAWLIVIHDHPFTPIFELGVVSKVDDGHCGAGEMHTHVQEFEET